MPPTLLVADDSVTIQRVIELTFADEDIRVLAVGDGQQAIDRIKADPPDIVLADAGMPERDGYDVAMFIKEDPALAHIPVVLLTGAFEPVDEDRAKRVGCDAVLVKPFEPKVVIHRVRELLGRRSAAAAPPPGPDPVVPSLADAPMQPAETALGPTHDPDATSELSSSPSAADAEPAPPHSGVQRAVVDDPPSDYLDQMDEALDRFEAGVPGRTASDEPRAISDEPGYLEEDASSAEADPDSLEDALSALDGALDKLGYDGPDAKADDASAAPDDLPSTQDPAWPPSDESVQEPVPAAGASSTPVPQGPPEPVQVAPVPPVSRSPESAVASAPEALPPLVQPSPAAEVPPVELAPPAAAVDRPPSLADAFASLLAAEQGNPGQVQAVYPWPRPASPPGMTEELIDRVAERVIARLSDGVTKELVAEVVARVAGKLVREELNRIKQS